MKIDAHSKTIEGLLKEGMYIVPDYQRPYSWTKEQIEELLEDVRIGMINDTNHFFGTVMLNVGKQDSEFIEIVDGQQRLSTVIIILYVILEMYNLSRFAEIPNIDGRKNALINKLNELNDESVIIGNKITLAGSNKEFFKEYIVNSIFNDSKKDEVIKEYKINNNFKENKKISDSFKIIHKYFFNAINELSDDDGYNLLKKYQSYILSNLELVVIKVEEDADAFLIFETLNDRGLALSAVDLIKNIIFKNCTQSERFEEIKEKWSFMVSNLEDMNEVKKYLRQYYMAKYGFVSPQSLFKEYRKFLKSDCDKSCDFVEELYRYSSFYDALKHPLNGVFKNNNLISVLEEMNKFKFDLANPILIACYLKYKDEEKLARVAKLCMNFLIRYVSLSGGKATTIEKKIGDMAVNFSEEGILSKFKELSDDNILEEHLKNITLNYKTYLAYYLLVKYEESLHKNEPWNTTGRNDITIEHILPQTVDKNKPEGKAWCDVFGDEKICKIHENKLGNLTLLCRTGQSKAGNREFEFKKEVYKEYTDMLSTKELIKVKQWNSNEIEKRQKRMVKVIMKELALEL